MSMKTHVISKQKHVEQVKALCEPDDKVIVKKNARIDVIDSLCCGILVVSKRAHVGRIHNAHLSAIILKKESVVGRLTGTSLGRSEDEHPIVYVGRGTIREITLRKRVTGVFSLFLYFYPGRADARRVRP